MSKPSKIALFTVIGICIVALLAYGFLTSRKLDQVKEQAVDSNIDQFIYDEASDTLVEDGELEDLYDGEEVDDEDGDFEVYEEPGGWENLPADEPAVADQEAVIDREESTEEDVSEEEPVKSEPIEEESEPVVPVASTGKYVVVVGSYSSKRNANKKLKSLEEVGFEGSIDQLPGSRLESVIAGRFPSISEAERLAKKIEKEGLRAIVKTLD